MVDLTRQFASCLVVRKGWLPRLQTDDACHMSQDTEKIEISVPA